MSRKGEAKRRKAEMLRNKELVKSYPSLKGWGISLKSSEHNVKRLDISLKGTVNTGFAAIFITLNGSRHIVKLLKRIVSKIPYHTHCVNMRYVLSYTQ